MSLAEHVFPPLTRPLWRACAKSREPCARCVIVLVLTLWVVSDSVYSDLYWEQVAPRAVHGALYVTWVTD